MIYLIKKLKKMKNSAIFLDRDGVINVDKDYVYRIEDLEFYKGSIETLKKLQEKGFLLFIVTNQSGIGRGYYKEEDYLNLKKEIHKRLEKNGIKIQEEVYCPHHPEINCDCRKPSSKMINDLIKKYDIDKESSYMIGDKTSDIKAGQGAGIKTILVKTGKAGKDRKYDVKADYECEDLNLVWKIIV